MLFLLIFIFYFSKNAKLQLFIHIPEEIKLCGLILLAWLINFRLFREVQCAGSNLGIKM